VTGRLHALGLKYGTDKATFHQFCDFYEEHLPPRIGRLLEIGVMDGASLRMWRDFYPDAEIVGVDNLRTPEVDGVTVLKGDAPDWDLLKTLGTFDVIVDDGSHMTADQQRTFEWMYPALNPGGWYILEDLHTSYTPRYINSPRDTVDFLLFSGHVDRALIQAGPRGKYESLTAMIPARG